MNLKKLAQPREQLLGLAVLVFMFSSFFRHVYTPKIKQTQIISKELKTLKIEKDALEQLTEAMRQNRPTDRPQEEMLSPKMSILSGETKPAVQGITPLLAYITTPQFLNNIAIKSMSGILEKKESGYNKFAFIIHADGSFRNVSNYIKRIEELESLVLIDTINLKTGNTKSAQVAMELKGILFEWGTEELPTVDTKKGKKEKNEEKK